MKGLSLAPDKRWHNLEKLAAELYRQTNIDPEPKPTPVEVEASGIKLILVLVLLGFMLIFVLFGWFVYSLLQIYRPHYSENSYIETQQESEEKAVEEIPRQPESGKITTGTVPTKPVEINTGTPVSPEPQEATSTVLAKPAQVTGTPIESQGVSKPSQANEIMELISKSENGDEEAQIIVDLLRKADQGDAESQYFLGLLYEEGRGVPKNDAEAVIWLRKAADQGNAYAQYILGYMYEEGRAFHKITARQ